MWTDTMANNKLFLLTDVLLCLVLFRHQLPKSMMKHSCDIIMKDVSWEVSANVYWAFLHLCSCWLASWKKKSHPRATSSLKTICSSWWSHDIAQMLSGGRNSLITAMKFSENMFSFLFKISSQNTKRNFILPLLPTESAMSLSLNLPCAL